MKQAYARYKNHRCRRAGAARRLRRRIDRRPRATHPALARPRGRSRAHPGPAARPRRPRGVLLHAGGLAAALRGGPRSPRGWRPAWPVVLDGHRRDRGRPRRAARRRGEGDGCRGRRVGAAPGARSAPLSTASVRGHGPHIPAARRRTAAQCSCTRYGADQRDVGAGARSPGGPARRGRRRPARLRFLAGAERQRSAYAAGPGRGRGGRHGARRRRALPRGRQLARRLGRAGGGARRRGGLGGHGDRSRGPVARAARARAAASPTGWPAWSAPCSGRSCAPRAAGAWHWAARFTHPSVSRPQRRCTWRARTAGRRASTPSTTPCAPGASRPGRHPRTRHPGLGRARPPREAAAPRTPRTSAPSRCPGRHLRPRRPRRRRGRAAGGQFATIRLTALRPQSVRRVGVGHETCPTGRLGDAPLPIGPHIIIQVACPSPGPAHGWRPRRRPTVHHARILRVRSSTMLRARGAVTAVAALAGALMLLAAAPARAEVAAYPAHDVKAASPRTQISFRGLAPAALASIASSARARVGTAVVSRRTPTASGQAACPPVRFAVASASRSPGHSTCSARANGSTASAWRASRATSR